MKIKAVMAYDVTALMGSFTVANNQKSFVSNTVTTTLGQISFWDTTIYRSVNTVVQSIVVAYVSRKRFDLSHLVFIRRYNGVSTAAQEDAFFLSCDRCAFCWSQQITNFDQRAQLQHVIFDALWSVSNPLKLRIKKSSSQLIDTLRSRF